MKRFVLAFALAATALLAGACLDTIESGKMTKDLALITTTENPTVLNSLDFIRAVRDTLERYYA